MGKYKIGRDYGFVGTDETDIIEAESQEEAEDMAQEWALERVDSWASEIKEEDE